MTSVSTTAKGRTAGEEGFAGTSVAAPTSGKRHGAGGLQTRLWNGGPVEDQLEVRGVHLKGDTSGAAAAITVGLGNEVNVEAGRLRDRESMPDSPVTSAA